MPSSCTGSQIEPSPAPQGWERRAGSQTLQAAPAASLLSSSSFLEQRLGKHLLDVSKGKTLQTAPNFQAAHISAEKAGLFADCLRLWGSWQAVSEAHCAAERRCPRAGERRRIHHSDASRGDGAKPPPSGARGPWHILLPTAGPQQTPLLPRRQHSCGGLPVQRRFQPPLGSSRNKALIFQRLGGFRRAAGHPDRLICAPSLATLRDVALLREATCCRAPGPCTWVGLQHGREASKSGGASQLAPLPFQEGRSSMTWTPTDCQRQQLSRRVARSVAQMGLAGQEIVIKKCLFPCKTGIFEKHLLKLLEDFFFPT